MLPDRVSTPGPLTYESGALLIALRGLAEILRVDFMYIWNEPTVWNNNQPVLKPAKEELFLSVSDPVS